MLEIKGLRFRYQNDPWLFKNVNVKVKPGEVVGLGGRSGIGKTTFAKLISGYLSQDEGTITIQGKPITKSGIHPVQLVWQHPEKVINPNWRIKKVLMEVNHLDEKRLSEFGIKEEWLNRRPRELSGGELQRICIARALDNTTQYLIADEMTTMLDAITQAQIWQTVLTYTKKRGIGVLAISHDGALLERISDRIIDFNRIIV